MTLARERGKLTPDNVPTFLGGPLDKEPYRRPSAEKPTATARRLFSALGSGVRALVSGVHEIAPRGDHFVPDPEPEHFEDGTTGGNGMQEPEVPNGEVVEGH